jgi:hypothetical protein
MGTWGTGVLDDDLARDVYDRYTDAEAAGQTAAAIVKALRAEFVSAVDDADEGPVFWLAIAQAQWDGAGIEKDIHARVDKIIARGLGLERWREAGARELARRQAALAKFAAKIKTPRKTKRRTEKPVEVPFAVGDCLAIELGEGRFGAAVVTRFNSGPSSSHILSIVDFDDRRPPAPPEFKPPKWLHTPGDPTTIIKYSIYASGFRKHGAKYHVVDRIPVGDVPPPLLLTIANWSSLWGHLSSRLADPTLLG